MRCNDFKEGVAILAGGGTAPEAKVHVEGCADCARRLEELRRIVAVARTAYWTVPQSLSDRAKALMPDRPRLVARLLGSGLVRAGVRRGEARDFALHVGVEGFSIRLSYAPLPGGWEVLGRAPTADWTVVHSGGALPCGASGRFRLLSPDLDGTAFRLRKHETEIEVPSARELTSLGD